MKDTTLLSKKVTISCFLAGCLEMYDFAMFGLLASVIHERYFIFMSSQDSLIISYALFAVGFICRPFGSIIFGYIGDRHGRKIALVSSVSIMGFASLGMCLMPSYESIGIASCYLIAFARILQGISLGGEFSGGVIYAIEHSDKSKHGLVGSFVIAGCAAGILIATLVSSIAQSDITPDYSWRFAFLLGFGLSIVGYFIRKELSETPEFQRFKSKKSKIPLVSGVRGYPLESISTILISAAFGSNMYFVIVFMPNYLSKNIGLDLSFLPIVTTIIMLLLSSFWGKVYDKSNKIKFVFIGVALNALYILVMLPLAVVKSSIIEISAIITLHAILFSVLNGTINVFAVNLFPAEYRYSCYSLCHSLGMGLIGGTTPMVSALISESFKNPTFILGGYISALTIMAGIFIKITLKKQKKNTELITVNISAKIRKNLKDESEALI